MRLGPAVRVTNKTCPAWHSPAKSPLSILSINEQTRNIQIQATLAQQGEQAASRHVRGSRVPLGQPRDVMPLPASAINYAPYGDSVYVVTDMKDPKGQHLSRCAPAGRENRRLARRSGRDHFRG